MNKEGTKYEQTVNFSTLQQRVLKFTEAILLKWIAFYEARKSHGRDLRRHDERGNQHIGENRADQRERNDAQHRQRDGDIDGRVRVGIDDPMSLRAIRQTAFSSAEGQCL